MACPPPPRRMAWVQSCAGSRAESWGTQPGHKSGQRLFLILSEAQPVQGRDGGRLPAFPQGAGGLRKRRVAPTRCVLEWEEQGTSVGQGESAELCHSSGGRLRLPLSRISPCRIRLWMEQPCSFPCPWWAEAGGRLGARSRTSTLQPDTSWHHRRDVQENQGHIGARGPWGGLEGEVTHRSFLPHSILCKPLPPLWISAQV